MRQDEAASGLPAANEPEAQIVALVGVGVRVLHVGCGTGGLARSLVERGCLVSGLDADEEVAASAAQVLEELVVADLDTTALTTYFKAHSFDVVVFAGETLQRLADPVAALRDAAAMLAEGGRLLVSARNVAHGAVRLSLLLGLTDGLTDHLTGGGAFTLDRLCRLLEDAGLGIVELHSTVRDPLDGLTGSEAARLPSETVEWVRYQPGALDHAYVAVARHLDPHESFASRPAVRPALPARQVRVDDAHTQRVMQEREERHQMLTIRDHILGLEASLSSATARVTRARLRAREANQRARRARAELESIIVEIDRIARGRVSRAELRLLAERLRERRDDLSGRS